MFNFVLKPIMTTIAHTGTYLFSENVVSYIPGFTVQKLSTTNVKSEVCLPQLEGDTNTMLSLSHIKNRRPFKKRHARLHSYLRSFANRLPENINQNAIKIKTKLNYLSFVSLCNPLIVSGDVMAQLRRKQLRCIFISEGFPSNKNIYINFSMPNGT